MDNSKIIIPIFVPHKGCPFDCIYCNQRNISGQTKDITADDIVDTIESHLNTIKLNIDKSYLNQEVQIAFYGGSFTGIDKKEQYEFLSVAKNYIQMGLVNSIRISTRPDYINDEILNYLIDFGVKTIELGVQSMKENILIKSGRNHTLADVCLASELIKKRGLVLGIQTMVGLPTSKDEDEIDSAKEIIKLAPSFVRIYPTLVIRDTYLEEMYKSGEYQPLTLYHAIDVSARLVKLYNENKIKVIRIGLQASDSISLDKSVVGGPFHPAFGELVKSRVILRRIEKIIDETKIYDNEGIILICNPSLISKVIGQKRTNIEYLKDKYHFKKIKVVSDSSFKSDQIEIKV